MQGSRYRLHEVVNGGGGGQRGELRLCHSKTILCPVCIYRTVDVKDLLLWQIKSEIQLAVARMYICA